MRTSLVITSISGPNTALRELAAGCVSHGWDFVLAGDGKSPTDFALDGCRFLSLEDQRASGFALAEVCPEKSYTRKNLGYLEAIRAGAEVIVETDDDNRPKDAFWQERRARLNCRQLAAEGWVNIYQYFSDGFIYPRGFPLAEARGAVPPLGEAAVRDCPVQQGLADDDPDVDAVYRMLYPLPFRFELDPGTVMLERGAWCPFNSQNTTFFAQAFPLLFLPANCSFRMTDIWRSFVAQRVLHMRGMGVAFHAPTVWQERNEHDLRRDFAEELPGYLHNEEIRAALEAVTPGVGESIPVLMERCYEALIRHGFVGNAEEKLLQTWFSDLSALGLSDP